MRSLGSKDEAEIVTEAESSNLSDLGGLENETGVGEEKNQDVPQMETEERVVGTWEETQEKRIPIIHRNLEPDVG